MTIIRTYRSFRPFSDAEAWLLFRLAAYAEAAGWTMLIAGIGLRDYVLRGNPVPVQIAGRFHGTLFLIYALAAILLAPSLGWGPTRTLAAGLCSAPPYGSLLFESWEARRRKTRSFRQLYGMASYRAVVSSLMP